MMDLVSRVQRELPDTDRDRYDIAYQRGRAQARSTLLFGGLALGSALGAGVMWLLDPSRGAGRRAQLAQRLAALRNDAARTTGGRAKDVRNRVEGFAIERGIREPSGDGRSRDGSDGDRDRYGRGYREGFGRTAGDPDAPGVLVDDRLEPAEVARFGPAGPVAGASASVVDPDVVAAEDERADR